MKGKPEPRRGESRLFALRPEELGRLEAAAKSPREKLSVRLLGRFGLRCGELAHLNPSWVSPQSGTLTVPLRCVCTVCQARERPWRCKKPASHRALPVAADPQTWDALMVFFGRYSTPEETIVSERAVHKLVKTLADRAMLFQRVFPHALRATAASTFARQGANEAQLCGLMGWEDLASARPYVQASGVSVETMRGLLKPRGNPQAAETVVATKPLQVPKEGKE